MSIHLGARSATLIVLVALVGGCQGQVPGSAQPTGGPSAVSQPSVAPTTWTRRPEVVDVPFYKADTARTGVHPGPAPIGSPIDAWHTQIGCGLGGRTGVIGAGLLVTGCDTAKLVALDAMTGVIRWTAGLQGPSVGSPAIANGAVYVADGAGAFTSFDLATGNQRWTVAIPANRHPVVVGDTAYVGTTDGRFMGIATTDGSTTWSWQAPPGVGDIAGTVLDDAAYIGADDGILRVVSLADGSERWHFQLISGRVSTPSISADTVFVASLQDGGDPQGELYALDRATGADRWRFRTDSGAQIAPPTFAGDTVISPSSHDGLFAFDAALGTVRWVAETGDMGGQPPAIVGDSIVLGMDRSVAAFGQLDGLKLWEFDLGADLDGSPVVSGGMVFVGDNSGVVRALADADLVALLPSATANPVQPSAAPTLPPRLESTLTFDSVTSDLDHPAGLGVGPDGYLYVANTHKSEVVVLDPATGAIVRRWGRNGNGPGEFEFLRDANDPFSALGGIAVADDGTVYVVDPRNRRVQAFDPDGAFITQWGRFGSDDGQFLDPIDVAVGPDGSVFVVDDQRDDIQRFTPSGVHVATIGEHGTGPGQLNFTGGITVTADGTLINADWDNNRVQAWDPSGTFAWTVGSRGTKPGEFDMPNDVVVDEGGRMYVSDATRIQTFDADRRVIGVLPTEPAVVGGLTVIDTMVYGNVASEDRIHGFRILD